MHKDFYKRPLLWVLIAFVLWIAFFYRPAPNKRDVSHYISQQKVTVLGRIEGFPVQKEKRYNVRVKVKEVNGEKAEGYVYARFTDFIPQWKDEVVMTGLLKTPYGIDLLGNFDWRKYLAERHIFAEMRVEHAEIKEEAFLAFRFLRGIRQKILKSFNKTFSVESAAIMGGIVLGEKSLLSDELYTAFQDSGAIHLLVASGGNVGFVMLLCLGLFSFCGLSRRKIIFFSLFFAGLYTLAAGADTPLVRAYFMACCGGLGFLLGRNSGVLQGLIISCLFILCHNPAALFDTGFQMSFLATLAIVICLANYRLPPSWPKLLRFFTHIFIATLATQLALLPLFANVFYKFSITGLLSNMILVPLASCLMALGFLFYCLEMLHLGFVLSGVLSFLLFIFRYIVLFFASFPFSSVVMASWTAGNICCYYLVLFAAFNFPLLKEYKKAYCFLGAGVLLFFMFGKLFPKTRVYLLNEWNRSAVLVAASTGETLLFGDGISLEKINKSVLKAGRYKVDAVFLFALPRKQENQYKMRIFIPFEGDFWPEKTEKVGNISVNLKWGKHLDKAGNIWENVGYCGRKEDSVSYCVEEGKKYFCIGADGRFIFRGEDVLSNQRNTTIMAKF